MIIDRSKIVEKREQRRTKKRDHLYNWHPWYAWYPVQVPYYSGNWVWLQYIEREYYCNITSDIGFFGGPSANISTGYRRRMKQT